MFNLLQNILLVRKILKVCGYCFLQTVITHGECSYSCRPGFILTLRITLCKWLTLTERPTRKVASNKMGPSKCALFRGHGKGTGNATDGGKRSGSLVIGLLEETVNPLIKLFIIKRCTKLPSWLGGLPKNFSAYFLPAVKLSGLVKINSFSFSSCSRRRNWGHTAEQTEKTLSYTFSLKQEKAQNSSQLPPKSLKHPCRSPENLHFPHVCRRSIRYESWSCNRPRVRPSLQSELDFLPPVSPPFSWG